MRQYVKNAVHSLLKCLVGGNFECNFYTLGYSNYYPHPPVEEPWNLQGRGALTLNFQGRGYINLGISRGGGGLTLEFPGKGAFRIWNSKGRSNSHMEFPEGGLNFMGWKFHGRTYVRGKFPGVNVP